MRSEMRRTTAVLIAFALALTLLVAGVAEAQQSAELVRGLVKLALPNGEQVPAPRVEVKLIDAQRGVVARTYTGSDGLYHLRDMRYGSYELQIEHHGKTLKFAVKVDEKVEDVRPVVLR